MRISDWSSDVCSSDLLALAHAPEPAEREPQDPGIELVAQPPQHALAELAAVDVDDVFERAVDADQHQEHSRQRPQILQLPEREAEPFCREGGPGLGVQGLVDDLLRSEEHTSELQ